MYLFPEHFVNTANDSTLTYFNKILELLVLLQLFEEINSFLLMATELSIYFLHFSCIFL